MKMHPFIGLLRPYQWLKNGFVLTGVIFSHQWDALTLIRVSVAFLSFCAVASATYVINDILDVEADRLHPTKCRRPLASDAVTIPVAWWLSGGLVVAALALAAWVSAAAAGLVLAYWLLNVAYSWRLKHVVILDVFIISAGFMLRILVGTIGLDIAPSQWLLLCGLMLTLFLGFAKRRAELLMLEASQKDVALSRRVLDDYSPIMLDLYLSVTAACSILTYGLYTVSVETVALHGSKNLIYTLPFIVYGIFRYLFLLHNRGRGNDAANDLLDDRHLLFTVFGWLLLTLWLLS